MKRTPLKRTTPLRRTGLLNSTVPKQSFAASEAQRAHVKGRPCIVCGREASEWLAIDPAHVTPRSMGGCSVAWCCVPLCRDGAGVGCHAEYDRGELDLLPYLEPDYRVEQQHAVGHLGLAAAFRRITNDRKAAA